MQWQGRGSAPPDVVYLAVCIVAPAEVVVQWVDVVPVHRPIRYVPLVLPPRHIVWISPYALHIGCQRGVEWSSDSFDKIRKHMRN